MRHVPYILKAICLNLVSVGGEILVGVRHHSSCSGSRRDVTRGGVR